MAIGYYSSFNTISLSSTSNSVANAVKDYRNWCIDEEIVFDNGAVLIKVTYLNEPTHVLVYKEYDVFYKVRNEGTINPDDERVTKKFKFMELEQAKEYAASL